MTEQEIRARALDAAVRTVGATLSYPIEDTILRRADLFMVYIRLGMEGVAGMLKEAPK